MKSYLFLFALLFVITGCTYAQNKESSELKWYTRLDEAQKASNSSGKPIFAMFTGSDWCGWCHKLHKDVFAKKEFIDWAKKNVILLELDFPRNKQLPEDIQKQNSELQQVFHVQGYPTVWMFYLTDDSVTKKKNIDALGSQGYPQNAETGKEEVAFLKAANDILKNKGKNKKK